ncbi:hypothetical protein ACSBR2_001445 [Camellia fascicularis]
MVPGMKTWRHKKTKTDPIASPSGTSAHVIVIPLTLSDETQPSDDTQTFMEETQAAGVGKSTSTRVRDPTLGKGVQKKKIASKKGEKLYVYVNRMLNALIKGNATPATNELGLQIRRLCRLKEMKSWKKIDQSIKDVVLQAVLAYLLYKDWRYTQKQHFEKLVEEGVDDPYSHPPIGVCLNDWKHMIDMAWKDASHLKHSKAGKANRSLLPYNHTSGSRSFPIAMSLMDAMVNLQATATDAGIPLTQEELSRQVLGQRKNYLRGIRISPRPYSPSDSAARSRDKQMEAMRSEMEVLHEDLMKEKEEHKRDRKEMMRREGS